MLGKITVSLLFLLLVWGNVVAGLKVGLACPDWPLCHGKVLPPFRWDIYMEFMHRVIGAITSVFIILLSYKRFKNYKAEARLIPVVTVFLLIFQIILGGVVVLLKLPVDITTFHFSIAIIIFFLTFYMAFFNGEAGGKKPVFSIRGFSGLFFLLSILVSIQAVLGAYVRHSNAGLACPDFPTCLGYWIPPELSGVVLTHYSHRSLAYLIFIITLFLYAFSFASSELSQKRAKILILFLLILLQVIVGVSVIHSKLYFLATAFHLAVALLILSAILYLWFQVMIEKRV
ncbi:MAG TPA: COX15/CtaA family protein [Thermodesulfobacteriota bacterium]